MKTAAALCYGIRRRAAMFNRFLVRLQTVFDPIVWEMTQFVLGGICSFINGSASLGWQGVIVGILVAVIPQALTLWGEEVLKPLSFLQ